MFVDDDLLDVTLDTGAKVTLAFGDPIEVLGPAVAGNDVRVRLRDGQEGVADRRLKTRATGVLQFALVDVQQGDGMVIETPSGKVILVDGGDNEMFTSYLAARFRKHTAADPLEVEAIVVTHGDADHFEGLTKIRASETGRTNRRLFLRPKRLYHNGIIKDSGSDPKVIFGPAVEQSGRHFITALEDDLLSVDDSRMNAPFKRWKQTLRHWEDAKPAGVAPLESRRLKLGVTDAFGFLSADGVKVDVLGPIEDGPGLPLLKKPGSSSLSASHTINGHSVVLRVELGNVRILLSGDLNEESMARLSASVDPSRLEAEIVKVPHHGAEDFDFPTLKKMKPFVWLISSGDDNSAKEHIHPRANLLGSLGAASRTGLRPLIFCTELTAFFARRGRGRTIEDPVRTFLAFERTNFGIVHVRTDGERLFVFTHSGRQGMKEDYAYRVDADHRVTERRVVRR